MNTWSLGPNTFTAVATIVTAVVAIVGLILALSERRNARRAERPDLSGRSMGGGAGYVTIATTVRNPSRRTMRLLRIRIEALKEASFAFDDSGQTELKRDAPILPLAELGHNLNVKLSPGWKGLVVLRFDLEAPIGGEVVEELLHVPLGQD